MRPFFGFAVLYLLSGLLADVHAVGDVPNRHWDRVSARAAVESVDVDHAVSELSALSALSDGAATLSNLKALENRSDWPLPAREAAVFEFTTSLRQLPRGAVAADVMEHLLSFESRVVVPHEDHHEGSVPMFNVKGVAAGIENGWQRLEWASKANTLIRSDPALLVSEFIQSDNHNQRSGYIDALKHADIADVKAVQNIALEHLDAVPELTGIIITTAVVSSDYATIRHLLLHGKGAGFSTALLQLDRQLQASIIAELLDFAIEQAPATNAALAIAAWWPRLSHDPLTRERMLAVLSDPTLGSAAALALAQNPDLQTIKALQDEAGSDSIAAQRAQMALDLNRSQLINGDRP